MPKFAHSLTSEEFTLLLNCLPVLAKRGAFNLTEYGDIVPLYKKMCKIAKANPELFMFEEDDDSNDSKIGAEPASDESFSGGSDDEAEKYDEEQDEEDEEENDEEVAELKAVQKKPSKTKKKQ